MGERPGSLGRGPRNAVVIVARVLTYVTLLSLLASTFVLAVMLKGARQAHMNLWERLVEQGTSHTPELAILSMSRGFLIV